MSNPELNIKLDGVGAAVRGPRKRRRSSLFVGGALIAGLVVLAGFLFLRGGDGNLTEASVQNLVTSEKVPETTLPEETVDDGQMLWISPTAGTPISLRYVPLGTQLLLHVRVADLLSHSEGEKVIAALGPWGLQALGAIEALIGARADEIETCLLCLHPNKSGELGVTLRCELVEAWEENLGERFPGSKQSNYGNQPLFALEKRSWFLPVSEEGKTIVACPLADAEELIESGSERPPLARDLERLVRQSDQQRDVTLLFPTKFFRTSGRELLQGSADQLQAALHELVAEDAAAVLLSANWGEDFFLELQSTVALRKRPHPFGLAVKRRIAESPAAFTKAVLSDPLPAYGEKIMARLPAMLREVSEYTRSGEVEGISVMRCYLPLSAGHNLLMAAELTLNTRIPAGQTLASQASPVAQPTTLAAKLRQTTTLSFPKESLERALEMLSEDLNISIELRGSDLQLEGITKNQSLGVDFQDRPAEEILLAVLKEANPDRTASGPTDVKQKLVYVIREAVGNQSGAIVVTTRSAAARHGYKLPAVFGASLP